MLPTTLAIEFDNVRCRSYSSPATTAHRHAYGRLARVSVWRERHLHQSAHLSQLLFKIKDWELGAGDAWISEIYVQHARDNIAYKKPNTPPRKTEYTISTITRTNHFSAHKHTLHATSPRDMPHGQITNVFLKMSSCIFSRDGSCHAMIIWQDGNQDYRDLGLLYQCLPVDRREVLSLSLMERGAWRVPWQ
jgi:hypothetical protein